MHLGDLRACPFMQWESIEMQATVARVIHQILNV